MHTQGLGRQKSKPSTKNQESLLQSLRTSLKPETASKSSKHSSKDVPPRDEEAEAVYKEVKQKVSDSKALVLAVVPEKTTATLKERIKSGGIAPDLKSNVVIASPRNFQKELDTKVRHKRTALHLLVSMAVECITYHISKDYKNVNIIPCGKDFIASPNSLRIGSESTYCDLRAFSWDFRTEDQRIAFKRYQINHGDGCYFRPDDIDGNIKLTRQPMVMPNISEQEKAEISKAVASLGEEMRSETRQVGTPSVSRSLPPDVSSSGKRTEDSWFGKWKAFLAILVGAGTGIAAGAMWCAGGGVYIKGPLGFSLYAAYFNIGGACTVAAGSAFIAGGLVYFIPWDAVFNYGKWLLRKIWESIRAVMVWIREKLTTLGSTVVEKVAEFSGLSN